MFPQVIFRSIANSHPVLWTPLAQAFERQHSYTFNILYIILIYFFCYFWTAISFNPKDMSENLKNYGTFIPGYRPGRRTAEYLEKVMVRITYVGAGFLAVVAIVPALIMSSFPALSNNYTIASFYGGTTLLIAVSVAFDLVQKIDSHLVMRNYRGGSTPAPRCWGAAAGQGRPMCAPWPCDGHRVNPSRDRSEAEGAEAAGVSMGVRLFRARLSRVAPRAARIGGRPMCAPPALRWSSRRESEPRP